LDSKTQTRAEFEILLFSFSSSFSMDSVIEVQRQTHEEIERFERALYSLLSRHLPTHEGKLRNEHTASQILDRISSRVTTLNNLYQDEDARKAELDLLSAPPQQNDLSEFYSRLSKIQEHHSKYPDSVPAGFDLELAALLEGNEVYEDDDYEEEDRKHVFCELIDKLTKFLQAISLMFSGEEAYGKYLDLYANHSAYNNLKNIGKRPGYLQYLDILLAAQDGLVHRELNKENRFTKDYESYVRPFLFCQRHSYLLFRYIKNLHTYLLSFVKRMQPLVDVETRQREAEVAFNSQWEAGEIEGWEESNPAKALANGNGAVGIWCSACESQ
jgi:splicing factor 3A subunit 3